MVGICAARAATNIATSDASGWDVLSRRLCVAPIAELVLPFLDVVLSSHVFVARELKLAELDILAQTRSAASNRHAAVRETPRVSLELHDSRCPRQARILRKLSDSGVTHRRI